MRYMNTFFDCMNVRCATEHIRERNPDGKPYYDENDENSRLI